MHGILGSRKNWKTPARKVISLYPDYQAVVVDHRVSGVDVPAALNDTRRLHSIH
jgi:hypothetical protein